MFQKHAANSVVTKKIKPGNGTNIFDSYLNNEQRNNME